jgi:ribosome recycling factor
MSDLGSTIDAIKSKAKSRMEGAVSDLQHSMAGIRTGRASISLLDGIKVDYYGTPTPLNQLSTLHVPEPSMITAQPWDVSQIGAIEKAILSSDLGLNPSNDGKLIRIPIPPLNEERRKQLVKHLHNLTEDHRIAIRNVRRDANDSIKKLLKAKEISEDEDRRAHDDVQTLTNELIKQIDEASKVKEQEILEI